MQEDSKWGGVRCQDNDLARTTIQSLGSFIGAGGQALSALGPLELEPRETHPFFYE